MLALLAGVNIALAVFDAWLTRRRILDYGVNIEMNRFIKRCVNNSNPEVGVTVGVMLPVVLLTALFGWLNWPIAFAIMIGARLKMFHNQCQSLMFEHQLRQVKKRLDDMGSESMSPPSTQEPDGSSDPSLLEDDDAKQ